MTWMDGQIISLKFKKVKYAHEKTANEQSMLRTVKLQRFYVLQNNGSA